MSEIKTEKEIAPAIIGNYESLGTVAADIGSLMKRRYYQEIQVSEY